MRLVLVITALAIVLNSCGRSEPAAELFIVSPHNWDIKHEFETAFSRWHQQHYGTPVKIQWPDVGGTSTMIRFLRANIDARGTSGYDMIFGGGSGVFVDLARNGYLEAPEPLPTAVLADLPATLSGVTLRDKDNLWYGAVLSNFGFVVNKTRLAELGLPPPRTWEDLAGPEWAGELSLADPSKSGSVRTCYELILQQYGWAKGWGVLTQMFANAESVKDIGASPADETGCGNTTAGVVIDFFGRLQAVKQGAGVVEFIVPEGGSSLDPDPIAVLKGAPHKDLASHMVEFVLSAEGQKLWAFRPGTPGGPERKALGRLALRPEIYAGANREYLTDPANPFAAPPPLKVDMKLQSLRSGFLGDLIKAALIDNHEQLARAGRAAGRSKLRQRLGLLPFAEDKTQAIKERFLPGDKTQAERNQEALRREWREVFGKHFAEIERLARRSAGS